MSAAGLLLWSAGQGRGGHHCHAGGTRGATHWSRASMASGPEQVHDRADLAQVRHQEHDRDVQAVHRPLFVEKVWTWWACITTRSGRWCCAWMRVGIQGWTGPAVLPMMRHPSGAATITSARHHGPVRRVQYRRRHRDLPAAPPGQRSSRRSWPRSTRRAACVDVHLVCDNLSTNKGPVIQAWLELLFLVAFHDDWIVVD